MLLDYHIHTKRCRHAEGEMIDYVRTAERKKLTEIGFSDHCPYFRTFKKSIPLDKVAMPLKELPAYVKDVQAIRKKTGLPIKLGLEVDFIPNDMTAFNILKQYDFDYFIGSVHFIGEWGFDQDDYVSEFDRIGVKKAYRKYCNLIAQMADTCLFDIVGHLDLPKKFGHYPDKSILPYFDRALVSVKASNMAVEINTSGLDRKAQEMYPSLDILKLCFKHDIPITLGSDSHRPEEVGRYFDEAKKALKKAGYNSIVSFTGHRYKKVHIE